MMPLPLLHPTLEPVRRDTIAGIPWWFLTLLLTVTLTVTVACSTPSPPLQTGFRELDIDFPIYPPAEPYLRYQKRLKAYKKPPPPPRYTAKNERIFRELERLKAISQVQVDHRNRLKAAAKKARETPMWERWGTYHARLARVEKAQVARKAQLAAAGDKFYSNRFLVFEKRLQRLEVEEAADTEIFEERREDILSDSSLDYIRSQGQ